MDDMHDLEKGISCAACLGETFIDMMDLYQTLPPSKIHTCKFGKSVLGGYLSPDPRKKRLCGSPQHQARRQVVFVYIK